MARSIKSDKNKANFILYRSIQYNKCISNMQSKCGCRNVITFYPYYIMVIDFPDWSQSYTLCVDLGFEQTGKSLVSIQSFQELKNCGECFQLSRNLISWQLFQICSVWSNLVNASDNVFRVQVGSNVPTNPITITRIFPHWPMEHI